MLTILGYENTDVDINNNMLDVRISDKNRSFNL